MNGTARGIANNLLRSSAPETVQSSSRDPSRVSASSYSRSLIRGTSNGISNDTESGLLNGITNSAEPNTARPNNYSEFIPITKISSKLHGNDSSGKELTVLKNQTSNMYLSKTADDLSCLFAVQDVVTVRYWARG